VNPVALSMLRKDVVLRLNEEALFFNCNSLETNSRVNWKIYFAGM